jgi:hypothetical protein
MKQRIAHDAGQQKKGGLPGALLTSSFAPVTVPEANARKAPDYR